MIAITIEEAEKIYLEALTTATPEGGDARRAALTAVIEALEERWESRMDACCDSTSRHYDRMDD